MEIKSRKSYEDQINHISSTEKEKIIAKDHHNPIGCFLPFQLYYKLDCALRFLMMFLLIIKKKKSCIINVQANLYN
jgi:hypothetical protein